MRPAGIRSRDTVADVTRGNEHEIMIGGALFRAIISSHKVVPLEKSKQVVSAKATAVSGRETLSFCRVVYISRARAWLHVQCK